MNVGGFVVLQLGNHYTFTGRITRRDLVNNSQSSQKFVSFSDYISIKLILIQSVYCYQMLTQTESLSQLRMVTAKMNQAQDLKIPVT